MRLCGRVKRAGFWAKTWPAGCSEGSLLPSFPVWNSLLPLCCRVHSPFRRVDRLFQTPRPVLHDFRLSLNLSLFHKLVAHRVGMWVDSYFSLKVTSKFMPEVIYKILILRRINVSQCFILADFTIFA